MCRLLIYAAFALAMVSITAVPAMARLMESGDARIAQQATQAVVNISLWKVRDASAPGESKRRVKVFGSGFIIDPSGIVITNKHVVDGAISTKVILSDGNQFPAKVLGIAAMLDEITAPITGQRRQAAGGRRQANAKLTCEFSASCDFDIRIRRSESHNASKSHVI